MCDPAPVFRVTGLRCSVCPLRALLLLPADPPPPVKVTVLQVDSWVPDRRNEAQEGLRSP